ncbi:molybdopterin-dependent oxidoreductase [Acidiferrimicrobium sp. IK]|uniref:molybdopterin-dependent oxidoreductase n=1 Tax=Acidiferrimicrobium sp. IK TaxID=2871700 RepID=UPI0021CAF175|nr:molybdopterin-dependent oxidoreductase [Acidiferrimicrobium sp. IK]MCU4183404.1 molybdopterin-dependent oxidoreductase [Acidiferrimicrobium sp. IK]
MTGSGTAAGPRRARHASHWGSFSVDADGERVLRVVAHPDDPNPSPLLDNIAAAARHPARVFSPTVRRGWWEDGPGADERRGRDEWLTVGWDAVLDRLAAELERVRSVGGPEAVYAGSYGWASAGRFHHAQSQLRRFFNLFGGSTVSVNTYSTGAAERILPHVVGSDEQVWRSATAWPVIAEHTELLVCFGGLPAKNAAVSPGGVTRHTVKDHLAAGAARGLEIVSFSPLRDDVAAGLGARWQPVRPGTDVAVMLAMARVLVDEGLADLDFCATHCAGVDRFVAGLAGATPDWASSLSGVPAEVITSLARRMASRRTLVTTSWSLQRAEHGEQPVWASIALAALLGQIGLPGGGFGNGYSSLADIGGGRNRVPFPSLPGAGRPARSWIPVARVADMLLDPGGRYEIDGEARVYPAIDLVYWTGGNPFHHHQDLNRLRRALRRPATVVVHEPYWTATARHADVVLPATITLERNDVAVGRGDGHVTAMQAALAPYGSARNDFDIFAGLARRLGFEAELTEGREEDGWLRHLWARWSRRLSDAGMPTMSFDEFWAAGEQRFDAADDRRVYLSAYRADPAAHPLATPSGRIELASAVIDGYGYADCPGVPTWIEPAEWAGAPAAARWPLVMVANNPATRLHSQLDVGALSAGSKVAGREPVRIHPSDAEPRGVSTGDVVAVWNDRGRVLAGAVVSDDVMPGVVQLSTGAWYDPDDPAADAPTCVHGNPNVLTADRAASRLSQACTGQHALVELARFDGVAPPVRAHQPPEISGEA